MVGFRYEKWDEDLLRKLRQFASLLALFHHLLLQQNGDVDEALRVMRRLQELGYIDKNVDLEQFRRSLEEAQIITREGGASKLTVRGERFVRREALNQIFTSLKKGAFGEHRTPHGGEGGERLPETRPYEFGDELSDLDWERTMHNALRRTGAELALAERDFEISETEHTTMCATALLVDVSHSMVLYGEDRITPAKKVALALAELIQSSYPKDSLDVILFGDDAMEVPVRELPYIGAGPFHTNTRAGLQLAQRVLRRKKHPNKQIFMVTDGKASAITENGRLYKNPFGLDPKIVSLTLDEAARCRRGGIVITTFMLTDDPTLVDFVNRLTRINRGRAYFSSASRLGDTLFVDYLRNRKRRVR
ncbi:MAG: VWA domain-containing protein [Planctomycetes bacterium]|nr:VWA domain-containing protein [Planctomycetota bacterium]